jgi:23S rRNA pseudouridine2605 synthase
MPRSPHQGRNKPAERRPRRRPARPQTRINDQPGERLQKVLAGAGLASRRESEELILEGRVEVDGEVVTELGTRVDLSSQEVFVDGERLPQPKPEYFAVHKPPGVVCTARDPAGRTRVTDLLPPDVGRVYSVGRLDIESEGLILVTNDGELANQLTHPRHGIEKTYEVQVAGHLPVEVLAQMRKGVHLAEGYVKPVRVRSKGPRKKSTILEIVLDEGRNREIRRLLARVGHKVQRLTRIAVGPLRLGDLPRGAVRRLTPQEVSKLRACRPRPAAEDKGAQRPRRRTGGRR